MATMSVIAAAAVPHAMTCHTIGGYLPIKNPPLALLCPLTGCKSQLIENVENIEKC